MSSLVKYKKYKNKYLRLKSKIGGYDDAVLFYYFNDTANVSRHSRFRIMKFTIDNILKTIGNKEKLLQKTLPMAELIHTIGPLPPRDFYIQIINLEQHGIQNFYFKFLSEFMACEENI
jgi:hypothetical protein